MSGAVNLFGEDIATNTKIQEAADQIAGSLDGVDLKYQTQIDAVPSLDDPSTIYFGVAPTGAAETDAVWAIRRITITSSSVVVKNVKGVAWSNRTTEVYS